jgi:hypothetical protein
MVQQSRLSYRVLKEAPRRHECRAYSFDSALDIVRPRLGARQSTQRIRTWNRNPAFATCALAMLFGDRLGQFTRLRARDQRGDQSIERVVALAAELGVLLGDVQPPLGLLQEVIHERLARSPVLLVFVPPSNRTPIGEAQLRDRPRRRGHSRHERNRQAEARPHALLVSR